MTLLLLLLLIASVRVSCAAQWSEFSFTRGIYTGASDHDAWGPRWILDFPEADEHFLRALKRLTNVDCQINANALPIGSQHLRDYPFVYLVEAGALQLDETELKAVREYLLAGGFMVLDDFWGTWAWTNVQAQVERIFPDRPIVDIPLPHPIFNIFYRIDERLQVPNVTQADSGRTHEFDGFFPQTRGVMDDQGRLMVLLNWNTDLGDAWEWADSPRYPLRYSNYAFKLGINFAIYALTY